MRKPAGLKIVHQMARHPSSSATGWEGELLYNIAGPDLLDLYHAEVSPKLRGRGIAGALVQAACDYARANRTRFIPSCPYVAAWFRRHPEQEDLVIQTA
jgi:predicted GNAT family acetyltransferase